MLASHLSVTRGFGCKRVTVVVHRVDELIGAKSTRFRAWRVHVDRAVVFLADIRNAATRGSRVHGLARGRSLAVFAQVSCFHCSPWLIVGRVFDHAQGDTAAALAKGGMTFSSTTRDSGYLLRFAGAPVSSVVETMFPFSSMH